MTLYKSEQAFSRALCAELRKNGFMVQRLESPETGVGIPDLVAIKKGKHYWIELKNESRFEGTPTRFTVKWRKGQQAWALMYKQYAKQCTFTIVAGKAYFYIIPMLRPFHYDEVTLCDYDIQKTLQDVLKHLEDWTDEND